jgi:hypothetical protein
MAIPDDKYVGYRMRASDINAMLAEMRGMRQRISQLERIIGRGGAMGEPAISCQVVNNTGADLPPRSVVVLGDQAFSADEAEREQRVMEGDTPGATDSGKFAIFPDGVGADEVARAYVQGICLVDVNVTNASHEYADVTDGETGYLASGATGTARILDREGGLGEQWAIIQWPVGGGGGGSSATMPRLATVISAPIGSGGTYTVQQWDTVTPEAVGPEYQAESLQDYVYDAGQLVTTVYDANGEQWVISDPMGKFTSPTLLAGSGSTANADTWNRSTATDGVYLSVVVRQVYDEANERLYRFTRLLTFDTLGLLASISAETRVEDAVLDDECPT